MKSNYKGLIWKHIIAGFLLGLLFIIPEIVLLELRKYNIDLLIISKKNFSLIVLCSIPFILSYICYRFAKVRVYLIHSNQVLKSNESEKQSLLEELLEYKFALDQSSIISVIDNTGKIKRVNDKFEELTGLSSKEVIGRSIWRLPSSIQKDKLFSTIKNVADTGTVWNGEISYYRKNGNTCYTRAIVVPLSQKAEGNNDCLIIQYDITNEKVAEINLRQVEEENRIILENTQTLICSHDANGIIRKVNKSGAKILGAEPEQLIGVSIEKFLSKKVSLQQYLDEIFKKGYCEGHFSVMGNNNEKRTLLFKNVVCKEKGEPYIIGSAIDLTETLKAKKELENQKAFISLMIDESPDLIVVLNEADELTFMNKTVRNYFDLPAEDQLGKEYNEAFSSFISGGANVEVKDKYRSHFECQLVCKTSNEFNWFKVQKTFFFDKNGAKFYLIVGTNITEKHQTELDLIEAKKVVENVLKAKEQFFANMSHEIRTPLNSVIGFSHLLEDTKLDESQREYVGTIKLAGKNLLSIINDVLDLSKMINGNLTLSCNKFNVKELVTNAAKLFAPKVIEKGIFLDLSLGDQLPGWLYGDDDRINQILINLVANAIKFTTGGGVTIRVRQVAGELADKAYISFEVQDTGLGIEKDKCDLIFQRYSQANNGIHKAFGGTGLGLNIVKNLVELFGGEIKVVSEVGVGSTFSFVLPIDADNKCEVHTKPIAQRVFAGLHNMPLSILLAEDNNTNAKMVSKILERKNFIVKHVKDGYEVLDELKLNQYDVILMDVQMLKLDGLETTRLIRNSGTFYAGIPIIALTAHSFIGKVDICREAGMNAYVSKPFNPDDLFNTIDFVMDSCQLINQ